VRLPKSLVLALLLLTAPWASLPAEEAAGPLRAYVERPDDSYGWVLRRSGELGEAKYAELTLTSQTWRDIVWKHQLFVIRPSQVDADGGALLLIGGGRWKTELEGPPGEETELPREAQLLLSVAEMIRAPVAVLMHVPQQPMFDGMVEDEIISYTFEQYFRSGDAEWPLLLPMVKSAVRGMDAVQEFSEREWALDVKWFTLTGGSKRGWTTWLTSAVDARVTALAPMVIDVLNMRPQMEHQLATWGTYSEQIEDYTRRGLQQVMVTERGAALNAIVDPYSYREVLSQPKLIMLGTNDRYWPLDSLNLYWDGLTGEKHVLYVPNNGHGLKDLARITGGLAALHKQAAGRLKLPEMTWELTENGDTLDLVVRSDTPPAGVSAWFTSASTKDFRESVWQSTPALEADGAYRYQLKRPTTGYAALFGEAVFEDGGVPYYLSTNVRITSAPAAGE